MKVIYLCIFMLVFLTPTNISAQNTTETPLISAVLYKDISEVKKILAKGVNINEQDENGYTALIWSCSYSTRDIYRDAAKLLIAEGADITIQANDGNTAIIEAAENSTEIFNMLLEKGADIHIKKADGSGIFYNCLGTMINYGREFTDEHMNMINYLIANGANVDDSPTSGDLKGFTPLIFAARENLTAIAKLLIEHGANVNAMNVYDQTPLSLAESAGHAEMIHLLISHGAK